MSLTANVQQIFSKKIKDQSWYNTSCEFTVGLYFGFMLLLEMAEKPPMLWLYVAPSTPISKPGRYRSSLWKLSQSPLARSCDASELNVGWYKMEQVTIQWHYGGFLKWWVSPTTMDFPTKNDHFGVFWGYHHLRKHPYVEQKLRKEFRNRVKTSRVERSCNQPSLHCSWSSGASKTIQWQIMIVTTMIVRFNIVLYCILDPAKVYVSVYIYIYIYMYS